MINHPRWSEICTQHVTLVHLKICVCVCFYVTNTNILTHYVLSVSEMTSLLYSLETFYQSQHHFHPLVLYLVLNHLSILVVYEESFQPKSLLNIPFYSLFIRIIPFLLYHLSVQNNKALKIFFRTTTAKYTLLLSYPQKFPMHSSFYSTQTDQKLSLNSTFSFLHLLSLSNLFMTRSILQT